MKITDPNRKSQRFERLNVELRGEEEEKILQIMFPIQQVRGDRYGSPSIDSFLLTRPWTKRVGIQRNMRHGLDPKRLTI